MSLFKVGQALGKTVKGLREKYEDVVPENVRNNITATTQHVIHKTVETTNKVVEQTGDLVKEKSKEIYHNLSEQNQQRVDQFQETFSDNVTYTKNVSLQALKKISENIDSTDKFDKSTTDKNIHSEEKTDINENNSGKNNKPKM